MSWSRGSPTCARSQGLACARGVYVCIRRGKGQRGGARSKSKGGKGKGKGRGQQRRKRKDTRAGGKGRSREQGQGGSGVTYLIAGSFDINVFCHTAIRAAPFRQHEGGYGHLDLMSFGYLRHVDFSGCT